jgi:hypothetical protein
MRITKLMALGGVLAGLVACQPPDDGSDDHIGVSEEALTTDHVSIQNLSWPGIAGYQCQGWGGGTITPGYLPSKPNVKFDFMYDRGVTDCLGDQNTAYLMLYGFTSNPGKSWLNVQVGTQAIHYGSQASQYQWDAADGGYAFWAWNNNPFGFKNSPNPVTASFTHP